MKWIQNLFNKKENASINQELGDKNKEAENFIEALKNPNYEQRKSAIIMLGRVRYTHAVEPLIELLSDPDESIRILVVASLGDIGDSRAVKPLISCIDNDTSGAVRSYTAGALGYIGDTAAIEPLLKVAYEDEDIDTRQDARTVLVRMFNWLEDNNSSTETRSYYNKQWNFSISYPADWREFRDEESLGQWYIPISVGEIVHEGWLKCMVNVRSEEILNRNTALKKITIDKNGKTSEQPANIAKYINQTKEKLQANFPGFKLVSTEEIQIDNKPAAKIVYIRGEEERRIYEEYTTLFGVGNTFLFICEVPHSEMKKYQKAFKNFIDSFKIGNNVSKKSASQTHLSKLERNYVEVYNKGVTHYRNGDFKKAIKTFEESISIGEISLQSAYALCMCQQQLGLPINLPDSFKGDADSAGSVFLGTNIACHIIAGGHRAAITKKGEHTELEAMYGSTKYLIHVDDIFGQFMTNVWRIENDKKINIIDPNINPNPTEGDNFVRSITKTGTSLSLKFLPIEGLKDKL